MQPGFPHYFHLSTERYPFFFFFSFFLRWLVPGQKSLLKLTDCSANAPAPPALMLCSPAVPLGYGGYHSSGGSSAMWPALLSPLFICLFIYFPLLKACKQRLALQEASAGKRELRRAGCRGCGRAADDEEEVAPQRSGRARPPPAARLGAFAPPRRSAGLSPGSGSSRRAGGGGRRPAGAGRGTREAEPAPPGPAILAPGSGGRGLRGRSVRAAFPGQSPQAGSPHSCAAGQPLSGTCWRWERKGRIRGVSEMRLRLVVPGLPWGLRTARSRFFSSSKTILSNQK